MIASNNNCSDTAYFEVTVDNAAIDEIENLSWSVYPNPSSDFIQIEFNHGAAGLMNLIDGAGRLIQQIAISNQSLSMDISTLASGAYQLEWINNSGERMTKCIVKMP